MFWENQISNLKQVLVVDTERGYDNGFDSAKYRHGGHVKSFLPV